MELKSEQKFDIIQVTDIDIAFPGELQTFNLRPEDAATRDGDKLTLLFAAGGEIEINLQHAHYMATRKRSLRVAVPEAQTVPTVD